MFFYQGPITPLTASPIHAFIRIITQYLIHVIALLYTLMIERYHSIVTTSSFPPEQADKPMTSHSVFILIYWSVPYPLHDCLIANGTASVVKVQYCHSGNIKTEQKSSWLSILSMRCKIHIYLYSCQYIYLTADCDCALTARAIMPMVAISKLLRGVS